MNYYLFADEFLNVLLSQLNIPFSENENVDDKIIDFEKFMNFLNSLNNWEKLKLLFFLKAGKRMNENNSKEEVHLFFSFLYNLNAPDFKNFIITMFDTNPIFYNDSIIRKKIILVCKYNEL